MTNLNRVPALYARPDVAASSAEYKYPVAIILRTKDRPVCLLRALISILSQTFNGWQLVIVNEGGDKELLERKIKPVMESYADRVVVLHHDKPVGRGPAINAGIKVSSSEFIVVHDDDDTWQPDFLQETLTYLSDKKNDDCGGVITYSAKVVEEMVNDTIVERGRTDFNSFDNNCGRISLFRMLMQNTFPPISFVYRRSAVEKIDYYNDLPVLEDWDFNLRFMFEFEIGVIPKHLANYHHRLNQQDTVYGNCIIAQQALCYQYETLIRNTNLRQMLHSPDGSHLLGLCLALGGNYLPAQRVPLKTDYLVNKLNELVNHQQSLFQWIEQKLRAPIAEDFVTFQRQLQHIQLTLDKLMNEQKLTKVPVA